MDDEELIVNPKLEALQTTDVLLERTKELKFRQRVTLEIRKMKIKFELIPRGLSLGSTAVNLKINKLKILYLLDFTLLQEIHINPLNLNRLFEEKFDVIITKCDQAQVSREKSDIKSIIKNEINTLCANFSNQKCNSTIFVINDISRIFEYILALGEFIKSEELQVKIAIPTTYDYYINIMKRLSEYMSFNIAQNFNFDYYLFEFEFLEFMDEKYKDKCNNMPKLVICSEQDLLCTNVLSWMSYNGPLTVVYENSEVATLLKSTDPKILEANCFSYVSELFSPKSDDRRMIEEDLQKTREPSTAEISHIDQSIDQNHFDEEDNNINSDFVYFKLINDFWEFRIDEEPIESKEFGELFSIKEIELLQANNIVEDKMHIEEELGEFQREAISLRTKEFYTSFITFATGSMTENFNKLKEAKIRNLNYNYKADFNDLILLLAKLRPKIVLLADNDINEQLLLQIYSAVPKSLTISIFDPNSTTACIYTSTVAQNFNLEVESLNNVEFEEYNSELQFAKVKFRVNILNGSHNEVSIKKPDNQYSLSIFREKKLLNLYKYFQQAGFSPELKSGFINFANKVLLFKKEKKFVLEGCIGPEYYQIRRALYQYTEA